MIDFTIGFNPPGTPRPRTIEDAVKLMKTAKGWGANWNVCCFHGGAIRLFDASRHLESFADLAGLLGYLDSLQPSKTVTVTLSREDAEQHARLPFSEAHNVRVLNAIRKALEQ